MSGSFEALHAERRRQIDEAMRGGRWHAGADDDPVAWRGARWAIVLLLLLSLGATLTALVLFQATSEGTAKRSLRRAVAALSEVDVLLDRNYDALRAEASNGAPGDTFQLADFPVDVPLTRDDVLGSSKAQLRDQLLDRSAAMMYSDGTGPLRTTPGSSTGVGPFTAGGVTDRWLGFLTRGHHDMLRVLTFVLAGVSGLLCVTLAALCRGFARLASVGGVVLVASLPLLAAGAIARLYIHFAAGSQSEYLQREFLAIGRGLAWIPIRDGLALATLGGVALVIGAGFAALADRGARSRGGT
ncbi:MAG: hypothetical protein EPO22_01265 [Dehalococcoidia bacterium]|nr:MAG: hypothetical protein EPO22_01265 [Dehalococcoidia bacterium]